MKNLVLKDGTTIEVEDDSSVANIRIPVEAFSDVDELEGKFTRENMTEIELGVQVFHQVNPIGITVIKNEGGFVCTVHCQESLQDYVDNYLDNVVERFIEEGVIE